MKKKLLITLGCSITEGIGCYDEALNPNDVTYFKLESQQQRLTVERFHKFGWPNQVGKLLGYDKVLNLGSGGTGNSLHLKLFVDKVVPKIEELKKEYEVLVIWVMTEPTRFSFYTDESIMMVNPSGIGLDPLYPEGKAMERGYLEDIPELKIGPMREQIFLIKLAESLFRDIGVIGLFTSWVDNFPDLYEYYTSPSFLAPHPHFINPNRGKSAVSKVCGHPNERGYRLMAEDIVEYIERFHSYLISGKRKEEIESEWDGGIKYPPVVS